MSLPPQATLALPLSLVNTRWKKTHTEQRTHAPRKNSQALPKPVFLGITQRLHCCSARRLSKITIEEYNGFYRPGNTHLLEHELHPCATHATIPTNSTHARPPACTNRLTNTCSTHRPDRTPNQNAQTQDALTWNVPRSELC